MNVRRIIFFDQPASKRWSIFCHLEDVCKVFDATRREDNFFVFLVTSIFFFRKFSISFLWLFSFRIKYTKCILGLHGCDMTWKKQYHREVYFAKYTRITGLTRHRRGKERVLSGWFFFFSDIFSQNDDTVGDNPNTPTMMERDEVRYAKTL